MGYGLSLHQNITITSHHHFTTSLHNITSHHFTTSLGSTSSHHLFTIGNSTSQHLFNTLHDISQAWPLKDEYHFQLGDVVRQFNFCSFRINLLSAEGCPQVDVFLENLVDSPSKTASTDGHPQWRWWLLMVFTSQPSGRMTSPVRSGQYLLVMIGGETLWLGVQLFDLVQPHISLGENTSPC